MLDKSGNILYNNKCRGKEIPQKKEVLVMTTTQIIEIERTYKNNGQHLEQCARFTFTGKIQKADNKPFTAGGDIGDLQVKSARATICKGTDIKAHIEMDGAERYGYIDESLTMYIMTKDEYLEFALKFATLTRESSANGGAEKLRLKSESKEMKEWLKARV